MRLFSHASSRDTLADQKLLVQFELSVSRMVVHDDLVSGTKLMAMPWLVGRVVKEGLGCGEVLIQKHHEFWVIGALERRR